MGHSTSSGRTTSSIPGGTDRQEAVRAVENSPQLARQVAMTIDKTAFTVEGNGNWQMDIEGVGGGQILDETGGSRDPYYGRGGKVYSIRAWDADYRMIHETTIGGSLNDAKRELRDALHTHYRTRG